MFEATLDNEIWPMSSLIWPQAQFNAQPCIAWQKQVHEPELILILRPKKVNTTWPRGCNNWSRRIDSFLKNRFRFFGEKCIEPLFSLPPSPFLTPSRSICCCCCRLALVQRSKRIAWDGGATVTSFSWPFQSRLLIALGLIVCPSVRHFFRSLSCIVFLFLQSFPH